MVFSDGPDGQPIATPYETLDPRVITTQRRAIKRAGSDYSVSMPFR